MIVSVATPKKTGFPGRHCSHGDIVAVNPANWLWGEKEVEQYDIVLVDLPNIATLNEARAKLMSKHYEENGMLVELLPEIENLPPQLRRGATEEERAEFSSAMKYAVDAHRDKTKSIRELAKRRFCIKNGKVYCKHFKCEMTLDKKGSLV